MLARHIFLGLILAIFISSMAFADGGFYGSITYKNCDCSWPPYYDRVRIERTDQSGGPWYYGVDCGHHGYSTQGGNPETFPPGQYTIGLVFGDSSNCTLTFFQGVTHGEDWQEVNLVAYRQGTPAGGDE